MFVAGQTRFCRFRNSVSAKSPLIIHIEEQRSHIDPKPRGAWESKAQKRK
jgi:hypothetical protein